MGFFWSSRRLPAVLGGLAIAVLLAISPRVAEAQVLNINASGITRDAPLRSDVTSRFMVSHSDCIANDTIYFPLTVANYAGSDLEVWATQSTSDNCRDETARSSASATCWAVYRVIPADQTIIVPIRVQDFAARPTGTTDGVDAGTAASCEGTTSTGQPVVLWFMFLQGVNQVGQAQSWNTTVDLLAPAPPAVGDLGTGNSILKLSWTSNSDPDVLSYRTFCEDLGTQTGITTYEAGAPGPEASVPPMTTCDAGGIDDANTGDDGGSDDASSGIDVCTPTPIVDDSGSGPIAGCSSSFHKGDVLSLDQIKKYECGQSGRTSTSITITGLTNGHKYAVAVTSSDLVENVGELSDVQCNVPVLTDSFDVVYRNAGGTAGGATFCSLGVFSGAARSNLWPGAAFAAVVGLFRWRRRRLAN